MNELIITAVISWTSGLSVGVLVAYLNSNKVSASQPVQQPAKAAQKPKPKAVPAAPAKEFVPIKQRKRYSVQEDLDLLKVRSSSGLRRHAKKYGRKVNSLHKRRYLLKQKGYHTKPIKIQKRTAPQPVTFDLF